MAPKPNIITIPCHPTNTWDRMGTKFEFIVMHYVGAVSTARDNGRYFANNANLRASAHFFVDEKEIVSSCPLDRAAGHCGVDYSNGRAPFWNGSGKNSTNRRSIGIEMCCKKDSKGNWYIDSKTVDNAVRLVTWLMEEFNIPAGHVIRHYDVCWKTCPEPWVRFPEQWQAFKSRLTEEEINMTKKEVIDLIDERIDAKLKGKDTKVSDWAKDELKEAIALGITDGQRPRGYATREEAAIMVLRSKEGEK